MSEQLTKLLSGYSMDHYNVWEAKTVIDDKENHIQIIEIRKPGSSCEFVRAIFDNYKLVIYGDYGTWAFNLTWKGNLFNMPYDNPWYWKDKLQYELNEAANPFDCDNCHEDVIDAVKDLFKDGEITEDEEIQKKIIEHLTDYQYCSMPEELEEYEEFIEAISDLLSHCDEYEWIAYLREHTSSDDPLNEYFGDPCDWSLWKFGKRTNIRIWINMYLLWLAKEKLEVK